MPLPLEPARPPSNKCSTKTFSLSISYKIRSEFFHYLTWLLLSRSHISLQVSFQFTSCLFNFLGGLQLDTPLFKAVICKTVQSVEAFHGKLFTFLTFWSVPVKGSLSLASNYFQWHLKSFRPI